MQTGQRIQLMDLNVQQQYHRNQVTSGKKNLLMSEDPLAASKSFAIQHSLANIEQMQKDIADSKKCTKSDGKYIVRYCEVFNESGSINNTSIKWTKW